jgi:hypothetical protein
MAFLLLCPLASLDCVNHARLTNNLVAEGGIFC